MAESLAHVQEFLRLLSDRGMLRGVDRRLRVELLLRELGIPDDPRQLHDLLVPVIARNQEEQSRFQELFDGFFGSGARSTRRSSSGLPIPPMPPPPPPNPWRRPLIAAGVLVLLGVLVALVVKWPAKPDVKVVATRDSTTRKPAPETTRVAPPRTVAPRDTLEDADAGLLAVPVTRPAVPPQIAGMSLVSAALIGLPMLFAASAARRRRSRARTADAERKGTPPYVYIPQPPKPRLFTSAEFYDAARVALRRQRMEGLRVSVERSVAATIDAGGLPTLRFEPASRPPEYLILIERVSPGDHQALLFDAMVQRLRQEGMMYVERFFFERDPRWCRSESQGAMSIDELQRRYHEHRLIILGDGYGLLDDRAAELAPWTTVFEGWVERAILTARPMASWSAPEEALAERFVILPSTPEGLRAIVESFELEARPDLRQWREVQGTTRKLPRRPTEVPELRASLDPAVWRWVCICAVYPNLHWALTLYLGTLPELGAGQLLREEHLLGLVALPWFREGFIPAEVRAELVDELEEETERAVRRTIANVLALDVPDPDTAAGRWHEAQLLVQGVLANPADPEIRAALEARVRELPRALLLRDPAATHRLRAVRHTPLDRLLPRKARRLIYRDGISLFGKRPWTRRSAGTAAVLAVAIVPSYLFMKRDRPPARVASFAAPLGVRIQVGQSVAFPVVPRNARGQSLDLPVAWSVSDSAIATVQPLTGKTAGSTSIVITAGGSAARIPVIVVPASRDSFSFELTESPKRLRVGDARALPYRSRLAATCDPRVATVTDSLFVVAHAAGTTRLVSGSRDSIIRIRELRVMSGSTDASTQLASPVFFQPGRASFSSATRTALDEKAALLRAEPSRAVILSVHPTAAADSDLASRVYERLASSGVSREQLIFSADATPRWSGAGRCATPPRSFATFELARVEPPMIASAPPKPAQTSQSAVRASGVVTRRPLPRTIPVRKPGPVADSTRARTIPTAKQESIPYTDSTAKPAYPNQAQQQLPAPGTVPYYIDSTGTPHGVSTAARGDSSEAPQWAAARLQLRLQRNPRSSVGLSRSDLAGESTVQAMPPMSYAFATPRDLVRVPLAALDKLLPVHSTSADSYDFEIHKVSGSVYLVGFVSMETVAMLQRGYVERGSLEMYASGEDSAPCPVEIPLAILRVRSFQSAPAPVLQLAIEHRSKEEPYVARSVRGCSSSASKK